jgi:hypothetical protein
LEFFGVSVNALLRTASLTVGLVLAPRTAGDGTLTKGDPNYWQKQYAVHKADESTEKTGGYMNRLESTGVEKMPPIVVFSYQGG